MAIKPTRLFVSHISEEGDVASLLKHIMEEDFLDMVKFFTSSDVGSINLGSNWLEAVEKAMREASAVIVLCSKASVQRPWVQFEVGAAWMKNMPIIPVCHSGMTLDQLPVPLVLHQGVELGTDRGLERLYQMVKDQLRLGRAPTPRDMSERLVQIRDMEKRFLPSEVQQFERYINVVLPAPGQLATETIPDDAVIESDETSLQLFGFIKGSGLKWKDIVRAAQKTADRRWVKQLQKCIYLASNNEWFRPVQAVYHTQDGSYQPQLSKVEIFDNGKRRFHVHFVETVVAPLSEVSNDFGLLATMLRLGLRFRYEVIESYRKMTAARKSDDEKLAHLRSAVEIIENDALSRGAQNFDRGAVTAIFEPGRDQETMVEIQDSWDMARAMLFRSDPGPTPQEIRDAIDTMTDVNYRFMNLGTRRFHEMVGEMWRDGSGDGKAGKPPVPLMPARSKPGARRTAQVVQ
ncbi:toll/interleukin-1 receptor domain-containing protein [Variovorax sp. GT1P44]|uniref:toll/interleukin-1 receptor domain-containing protein n=1 Tax=Variovorax sp. GT1P44 TaxID=3443742 RepID=UPI003F45E9FC